MKPYFKIGQSILPFQWELNNGMKLPLKRSRPFTYFDVLIFSHNGRIDLSLCSCLGFLQRQQFGRWRRHQQGLGPWQRCFRGKGRRMLVLYVQVSLFTINLYLAIVFQLFFKVFQWQISQCFIFNKKQKVTLQSTVKFYHNLFSF